MLFFSIKNTEEGEGLFKGDKQNYDSFLLSGAHCSTYRLIAGYEQAVEISHYYLHHSLTLIFFPQQIYETFPHYKSDTRLYLER